MKRERDIRFEPVTKMDLPVLEQWLNTPHWLQWWGDPVIELGYIRDMMEGRDTTKPFIFYVDGEPTGYIQYWFIADHQAGKWLKENPWLGDLPTDAIGVDVSIGPAGQLSRGVGTAVLQAFVKQLSDWGFHTIFIDPDETNHRAVRAYEKAGFVAYDRHETEAGMTLLMKFEAEHPAETKA